MTGLNATAKIAAIWANDKAVRMPLATAMGIKVLRPDQFGNGQFVEKGPAPNFPREIVDDITPPDTSIISRAAHWLDAICV